MLELQGNGLPVRAALRPDGLYLALREIDPGQLRDAFLQETVVRVQATETIAHIARNDIGKAAPGTAPAGIVFHVARCGSTLISQLLKQVDDCVVYAEPLAVNEILAPPHPWPRAEMIAALRSLGDAFARHARKPYVLKLSSWNTLFCDLVAEAFPASPWVFSLRDPVEVGVSMLNQPPGWVRGAEGPARELRKFIDPDSASQSPDEFVARLYGAFCMAAGRLDPERGKMVHYEHLPAAAWETVAPHFFLRSIAGPQRERMVQAARLNAKAPIGTAAEFSGDTAIKQAQASETLRQAIETFAQPMLERLLQLHARDGRGPVATER